MHPSQHLTHFHSALHEWYRHHARDLPWRRSRDPYRIWLSEVILQQTRVEQGLPYYERMVVAFPNVEALASADGDTLMRHWQGLGYYRRARLMQRAAREIAQTNNGQFPRHYDGLRKLPGIGDYTAAAISSIAFQEPQAVLDGNVARVIARLFDDPTTANTPAGQKHFRARAQELLDREYPGEHNQAMMELGACICTPRNPLCRDCPVSRFCESKSNGTVTDRPVKKAKAKLTTRYLHYLLLQKGNDIAVQKRPEEGIWGALYELVPLEKQEAGAARAEEFAGLLGHAPEDFRLRYTARHLLTHQRLECAFYSAKWSPPKGTLPAPLAWASAEKMEKLAFPKVINTFLDRFL